MSENSEATSVLEVPQTCDQLVEEYETRPQIQGEILKFEGVDDKDVYNITAPFWYKDEQYIIGRVESPDTDSDSQISFFKKTGDHWTLDESMPSLDLQDPFMTKIDGDFVIGGVEVYPDPTEEYPDQTAHRTVFYRGSELENLEKVAEGPENMKDIRLKQLSDGRIAVFTRPGSIFTRPEDGVGGKIGYTEIDSLNDLTPEIINSAEIIEELFCDDEWGGVNEIHVLDDGRLGILGHIARIDEKDNKHYYAVTFEFDPQTKEVSNLKIVGIRDDFPEGKKKVVDQTKSEDYLRDIVFSGGLVTTPKKDKADLYVGLSDAEAGHKKIDYPFSV